jgi:hypothetical protein
VKRSQRIRATLIVAEPVDERVNVNQMGSARIGGTIVHRRDCLRGIVGSFLVAALELPFHARATPSTGMDLESWLRDANLDFLGSRSLLRRLGAEYLAQNPQEHNVHQLSVLLCTGRCKPFDRHLHERIAEDWRDLDTAVADGWVLSRTEARLCAFLDMTEDSPG